ncbi:hypothetical protein QBC38DRAFT_498140 [Podospora fimiseda]|uniref:Uncharacterized protein n=1 Tax=Podospora fimiseda TaxID=252190 RepID=A0AAN7BSR8_9PEZI|nr:hypothetical protein QBC38DRAFT_498140 [Podospora fimiseda]
MGARVSSLRRTGDNPSQNLAPIKPEDSELKTAGQKLKATGSVSSADAIAVVPLPDIPTAPRRIFIHDKAEATRIANNAEQDPAIINEQEEYVLSCDGSIHGDHDPLTLGLARGYSFVVKLTPTLAAAATPESDNNSNAVIQPMLMFKAESFTTDKAFSIQHMELAGIAESALYAAKTSRNERRSKKAKARRFRIFTDSLKSLRRIKDGINGRDRFYYHHTRPFVRAIISLSHAVHEQGDSLELHWLPRCVTLGHKAADKAAKSWTITEKKGKQNQILATEPFVL